MGPGLRFLLEFLGIVTASALAWLTILRSFTIASILGGVSAGLAFAYVLDRNEPWHAASFALNAALFTPAAIIISFGIGIPFNRRRNPLPPKEASAVFKPVTSFTQRLSWQQVVAILLGLSALIAMRFWLWPP